MSRIPTNQENQAWWKFVFDCIENQRDCTIFFSGSPDIWRHGPFHEKTKKLNFQITKEEAFAFAASISKTYTYLSTWDTVLEENVYLKLVSHAKSLIDIPENEFFYTSALFVVASETPNCFEVVYIC